MENYKAIDVLIRYGRLYAALAACCVLAIGCGLTVGVASAAFWFVVSLCCACGAGFAVLLLRDIARIIADTLIPLP